LFNGVQTFTNGEGEEMNLKSPIHSDSKRILILKLKLVQIFWRSRYPESILSDRKEQQSIRYHTLKSLSGAEIAADARQKPQIHDNLEVVGEAISLLSSSALSPLQFSYRYH